MLRIRIHTPLTAKPKVTKIPPGKIHLSYSASGPGEVVEQLSVGEAKPVRFVDADKASRVLERKVNLTARPKVFSRTVQICRTKKEVTEEIFRITLVLMKVGKEGKVIDWSQSYTSCALTAAQSAKTCPKSSA